MLKDVQTSKCCEAVGFEAWRKCVMRCVLKNKSDGHHPMNRVSVCDDE